MLILYFSNTAISQEVFGPPTDKVHVAAKRANSSIKIDGRLEEDDWGETQATTRFVQIEPQQGDSSEFETKVRVLYNERNLYVGVWCPEPGGRKALRGPDLKRDFEWRAHDTFAICFDGFNDNRNSMSVVTNPYGVQKDYLSFDDTFFDSDWNGLWKVRTTRSDSGWVAEFEIPWKTLRYAKSADKTQSFGMNLLRLRRFSNEIAVWSPYPRSFGFTRMEYAGRLDSLVTPIPTINIQVNPYYLTRIERQQGESAVYHAKIGGEIKWTINPNTILDASVNTDFAQADADIQVNNLTRFSVLFPERRQFFLENASLFGAGLAPSGTTNFNVGGNMVILPFFTRRMGLNNGMPVKIGYGGRLVHRSLGSNYGGIFMKQERASNSPEADFFVGRFSQNIGSQNRIGALVTGKATANTDSTRSDLNMVMSVDGFFRLGKSSSINAMLITSSKDSEQHREYAAYVQYLYTDNLIKAWWTQSVVTKNFNPETGFVSRTNVIATTPGVVFNLRKRWVPLNKHIRALEPGVSADIYHEATTRVPIEQEIKITPMWINFQSGGYVGYNYLHSKQNLKSPFNPLDLMIAAGEYRFGRHAVLLGSDASKKLSYSLLGSWGGYFDGSLKVMDGSVSFAPIPNIAIKTSLTRNQFSSVGDLMRKKVVNLFTVESRFAVNPRIQLTALVQKNSYNDTNTYNIRASWEYKPLSFIYLVLNSRGYDDLGEYQQQDTGIFKLSYLRQF